MFNPKVLLKWGISTIKNLNCHTLPGFRSLPAGFKAPKKMDTLISDHSLSDRTSGRLLIDQPVDY